jgi:hypothetical protein
MTLIRISFAVLTAGLLQATLAQTPPPEGQGGPNGGHRGPPPEAVAACQGKNSGDACSFTGRENNTVNGSCLGPRKEGESASGDSSQTAAPLACRPQRGNRGARGAPS